VTNRHDIAFYISCKGSMRGERPGLMRTDTLKKALGEATILDLSMNNPLIVMTSHTPVDGAGKDMLSIIPRRLFFDVIIPWQDGKRLAWLYEANEQALEEDMHNSNLWEMLCRRIAKSP